MDALSKFRNRVVRAAEAALADHSYVSAIDVLSGMGLLAPSRVAEWRNGRIGSLEEVIQGNLHKISSAMAIFHQWGRQKGLKPSETGYVRRTREGVVDLRFSKSGDPEIEKNYRTHYVSPTLSEQKQKRLGEKLAKSPELVVFQILRDSQCSECGSEIQNEDFLLMEAGEPLCLSCAHLDDLEFLPAGDTALTRRARKYSGRVAVVIRFSRARNHYERQGLLVDPSAIEKAEHECKEDAEERAAARKQGAERRRKEDDVLVDRMAEQIGKLFPACPPSEVAAIARHTARRGSGRIGRTAAGRRLDEQALRLAVAAAVRHNHTNYDQLLINGLDRASARREVADLVAETLDRWQEQ